MNKQFVLLASFLMLTSATNINAANDGRIAFRIDCPEDFPNCEQHIGDKVSSKFSEKYPSTSWRIVVPLARFFVYGNGTLRGIFSLAVIPDSDSRTTADFNSPNFRGEKPKKVFTIDKNWPEIIAIDTKEFSNSNRFNPIPDARVYRAKSIVYKQMAKEAAMAMMAECEKSENCNLYEE